MPTATVRSRNVALTVALCVTLAVPAAVSARSPACGAAPVIGQDGAVLYWTGGGACAAAHPSQGDQDSPAPQDEAPVSRNSAPPDAAPAPESRPVSDAVTVAG
jgi:hypothetical protein